MKSFIVTLLASVVISGTAYAAPVISSISPNPVAAGATVTISGTGFGAAQGSSTVLLNGTFSVNVSQWSNTSIAVPVPSGALGQTTVTVVVGGVSSNGVSETIVAAATISGVSPNPAAQGVTATIIGSNFGATQGTSTLMSGGLVLSVTSWSNTSISTVVPSGAVIGRDTATLTVTGGSTNLTLNVVAPPKLTAINTLSGPPQVGIQLTGSYFGASQGSSVINFNNTALTASTWQSNLIIFQIPANATPGTSPPLSITVAGVVLGGGVFNFAVTTPLSCTQ